jgi:hypothetical protein
MAVGAIRKTLRRTAVAGTGLAGLVLGWSAVAQDRAADVPPKLVFDVSTTLSADDNRSLSQTDPDPGLRFDTRLGFTFDTRTRLQQLQFSGSTILRLSSGDEADDDTASGVQEPRFNLAYSRDTGNARLGVTASYARTEASLTDTLLLPDGTPSDDVADDGFVTDSALGVSLQTGVNDPIGFLFSADASERDYTDTTDPDVYDSRRLSLGFTTRLVLSPRTLVSLNLGYRESEDDNDTGTERTDRSVSVAVDQSLSEVLTLLAEVGYSRNTRDETQGLTPVSEESDGLFGTVRLNLERPNGTASVSFTSARDSEGPRNTLSFGRSLELPRGGELEAELGVTARPGGDPELVGSLRYAEPLPTGEISVSFDRSVSLDADDDDVASTRLGLAYTHDITELSRFNLSADYSRSSDAGLGEAETTTRRTLRAAYERDLTADWKLETGYQYRDLEDDGGDATSNSVFLTIGRKFVAWP